MTSRRDEALALLRRGHDAHLAADLARASSDYRRALALLPDLLDAAYFLAIARLQAGDAAHAADRLSTLLRRHPPAAVIAVNLGMAQLALGDGEAAAAAFRSAAALDPREAVAWVELGNRHARSADFRDAGRLFARAVSLEPMNGVALGNLGGALAAQGAPSADMWHRRALAAAPASSRGWINRGHGRREQARWKEARLAYDRAAALEPWSAVALSEALHAGLQIAEWSDLSYRVDRLATAIERGGAAPPFHLLALDLPPALKRINAERWSAQYAVEPIAAPAPATNDRLRLGYISGDFRRHAVAYEVIGLIEAHDRTRVDVRGYGWAADDGSTIRARLDAAFGGIVDLRDMSDAAAASRIAADGIDVLVDLSGHTYGARPGILARRPAKVQVNYFGFPGVTGAAYHDYALTDAIVTPAGSETGFREALARVPGCYWPHDPRPSPRAEVTREALGLPRDAVVLVCFNQVYKIQPATFGVWMRILRAAPLAVLWLLDPGQAAKDNLRRAAAEAGVAPQRIVFAPPAPYGEHLARIAAADLAIDTLPYNAHTTASDALSAGCPAATWIGRDFAGRVCASMLSNLGFGELIAANADAYAELVSGLAQDRQRLAALRDRLRSRTEARALFDMHRLARSVEAAAFEMRQRRLKGQGPVSFDVPTSD